MLLKNNFSEVLSVTDYEFISLRIQLQEKNILYEDTSQSILSKDLESTIELVDQILKGKNSKDEIFSVEIARNDESEVLRYNVSEQREKLLQLARG